MANVKRTIFYQGWATFGIAEFNERDGSVVRRVFEDHGSASCVLPYDPDRRVALLVRQQRIGPMLEGTTETLLEAPAGGLGDEDAGEAAKREAMEEVGVRLDALESVGAMFTMPSVSTERVHLFLAPYGNRDRVSAGGGLAHEGEFLEISEVPLAELAARVRAGELVDMKTVVLVMALQQRHPELFDESHMVGATGIEPVTPPV